LLFEHRIAEEDCRSILDTHMKGLCFIIQWINWFGNNLKHSVSPTKRAKKRLSSFRNEIMQNITSALTPAPHEQILAMTVGFWQSRALAVATELELADLMAENPVHIDELAAQTKTHSQSLFRLLRALESVGVFSQVFPMVFGFRWDTADGAQRRAQIARQRRRCAQKRLEEEPESAELAREPSFIRRVWEEI
jgi:hypothetical protein